MQSETPSLEHLRTQLAAIGITLDDERLSRLLPVYSGVLSGAHRLATLDLGATEPAMTFVLSSKEEKREARQ